jgi:hypothetical protein
MTNQLGDARILPGTRLEPLLIRLRNEAIAQPSRETSAAPERVTQSEPSSEDEHLQVVDELNRRRREEAKAGEDGIDRETDTEHETREVNATGESFEVQKGILPEIVNQMNELRD